MRSKLYLTSAAVTCRLTGGWKFTPWRMVNVYVLPSFVGSGTSVAMLGSRTVPSMPGSDL